MSETEYYGKHCVEEQHLKVIEDLMDSNSELEDEIERLKAALRLVAEPERQSQYTAQQIAKHALRIVPLTPKPE